jgi:hypothetical protein
VKFPCCSLSLVLLLISAPADARRAGPAAADDLPRHGIAGLVVAAADSAVTTFLTVGGFVCESSGLAVARAKLRACSPRRRGPRIGQ